MFGEKHEIRRQFKHTVHVNYVNFWGKFPFCLFLELYF